MLKAIFQNPHEKLGEALRYYEQDKLEEAVKCLDVFLDEKTAHGHGAHKRCSKIAFAEELQGSCYKRLHAASARPESPFAWDGCPPGVPAATHAYMPPSPSAHDDGPYFADAIIDAYFCDDVQPARTNLSQAACLPPQTALFSRPLSDISEDSTLVQHCYQPIPATLATRPKLAKRLTALTGERHGLAIPPRSASRLPYRTALHAPPGHTPRSQSVDSYLTQAAKKTAAMRTVPCVSDAVLGVAQACASEVKPTRTRSLVIAGRERIYVDDLRYAPKGPYWF